MAAVAAAVALVGAPPAVSAAAAPADPVELIVVFEPGAHRDAAHAEADAAAVDRIDELNLDVVEVEGGDGVDDAIAEYTQRPDVAYVEVNATVQAAAAVDDPLYAHQWHLHDASSSNKGTANVENAWGSADGRGVVVAVIDTGVAEGGSDLDASRILDGRDFVNDDSDAHDDNGHGTHIAGTIAQSTDNGTGVAGVAPRAKVLPVKVLNAAGAGTYSDVIDGLLWAKDRADVLN
ncbi:MAG TPA: S8 family serine peptidase, partial [Acidimicrobiia bacterium]|nr:S8 family serine peptidase [Acidimicrobiia bacterium]